MHMLIFEFHIFIILSFFSNPIYKSIFLISDNKFQAIRLASATNLHYFDYICQISSIDTGLTN